MEVLVHQHVQVVFNVRLIQGCYFPHLNFLNLFRYHENIWKRPGLVKQKTQNTYSVLYALSKS